MRGWRERILGIAAVTALVIMPAVVYAQSVCTHYASPSGRGSGTSASSPFSIADFWSRAKPGDTLCLLDGTYRGGDSMIKLPNGLSGVSGRPITVRALQEGRADIDGQGVNGPVDLNGNAWIILEGFNAHSSADTSADIGTVINIGGSKNVVVRRVVAWDGAPTDNGGVFAANDSQDVLFEDAAGFGTGRKIFVPYKSERITFRRCWGSWDGSQAIGPKMTFSQTYRSHNIIIENAIGTWTASRLPSSWIMTECKTGKEASSRGCQENGGRATPYDMYQAYGPFAHDGLENQQVELLNAKLFGNISYITNDHPYAPPRGFWTSGMNAVEYRDNVTLLESNHSGKHTFGLYGGRGNQASGLTSIGGAGPEISSAWQTSNIVHGSSVSQTGDIYTNPKGARICKRYKDGQLSNVPLWPWPMNQRIIDAMRQAGRQPVDVTATIEKLFGPIPAECRGSGGGPPVPGPCHTLDSGQAVPAGYGAAYNVHTSRKELLVAPVCDGSAAALTVGNNANTMYVYNKGYHWDGSAWRQISLQCSNALVSGAWCEGEAKGTVPVSSPWHVAYTCHWTGSQWKCGCRDAACGQSYWQLQGVQ